MARIRWKQLKPEILRAIAELRERDLRHPTIRGIYYILSDTYGLVPGIPYSYKKIDELTVEMRKEGEIPWGFFSVERGVSREATSFWDPKDYAKHLVREAKESHETYDAPRWLHQKTLVEVWVEKKGLVEDTKRWLSELDVTVRSPQGYGTWEFLHEIVTQKLPSRLKSHENVQKVEILYLGDLDPSGKDMPRFLDEDGLDYFRDYLDVDLRFTPLALEPHQVRDLGLPQAPESGETRKKILRDPRYKWYVRAYGEIFSELDSFYHEQTEEARELVQRATSDFFDEDVYASETEPFLREAKETVHHEIRERIRFLDDDEEEEDDSN